MRYEGQNYEQEISVPEGEVTQQALEAIFERYHHLHHEFYGYRLDGLPVELVRLTVTVTAAEGAAIPDLSLETRGGVADQEPPDARSVEAYFGDGFETTPVVPRSELVSAGPRPGPLIVESMDTTVVVPPGWTVQSDAVGVLELQRAGARGASETTVGAAMAEE
jgi:N-methylhydantoinase A